MSGNQMHLGYHELRNTLKKFMEERDKRRSGPAPSGAPPSGARPNDRGGDYRKDEYRDRGYDRDRPRHE